MSLHWTTRQLARALKQIRVPVEDVRVGDILVTDNVRQVARIQLGQGIVTVYDEDDNGVTMDLASRVWLVDRDALAEALAEATPIAGGASWSREAYEIWKALLNAWFRHEILPLTEITRLSGSSAQEVTALVDHLVKLGEIAGSVQYGFGLVGFPRKSLDEILEQGAELRDTRYYVDASGRPPNARDLLRRIMTHAALNVALGGVAAARDYMPDFNLNGNPRIHLSVVADDDLAWVKRVDPALTEASGQDSSARLVVHRERMRTGVLAPPAEVLLDLYELRLIDQADEFVTALRAGRTR